MFLETRQATLDLPFPRLIEGRFASITAYTDEALLAATGVRIAFTTRHGGVSTGPYASLNVATHVHDDVACVLQNRALLLDALGCTDAELIVPNQVHGDSVLVLDSVLQVASVREEAAIGADALMISTSNVAALLCFADCVPVIAVAPTGEFAVIHAGWRGVANQISVKACRMLAQRMASQMQVSFESAISRINVYIGPHIHGECFQVSKEIHQSFVDAFGARCSYDETHIDLAAALVTQLAAIGIDEARICDVGHCTVCDNDTFFSFRGQDGVAGRHGAFACRMEE